MERNDWGEAYELLNEAAASGGLDPDAFEDLARSAWWSGRPDECIDARERAYAGFIKSDEPKRAALMALDLAEGQFHKKATAIGDGWVRRAERLLASEPAFDDAQNAVDCAVEIQRTFARQRTEHGFAPNIRIGLHIGDVTEIGGTLSLVSTIQSFGDPLPGPFPFALEGPRIADLVIRLDGSFVLAGILHETMEFNVHDPDGTKHADPLTLQRSDKFGYVAVYSKP